MKNKRYFIYGAGDVAKEVLYCLQREPHNLHIEALVVSDTYVEKGRSVDGIPVISCDELERGRDVQVIVAVLEKYRDEICAKLACIGIQNPILMTFESDLWCEERGKTYALYRQSQEELPYLLLQDKETHLPKKINRPNSLMVYVAKSHLDKPLKERIGRRKWETDIQVGSALTELKLAEVTDGTGESISEKNKQYCELTALYWIWKNAADSGYVGLCHYRRHFLLEKEDIERLTSSYVDVVVTNPVVNVPDVRSMYDKNHILRDWEIMKEGVGALCREYLETLDYVERSHYYIPYNMFIMRREVLNQYCEWLFPILEYCELRCEPREDIYQNRYIGFLAERLMTVYLRHHRETLVVAFSKRHFCE